MKLASVAKISAVALAIATTPAFADDSSAMSITINGKTYTLTPSDGAATDSSADSGCKTCGKALPLLGIRKPSTICVSGKITGTATLDNFEERMKELANDPDATVVKDDAGNIKSVKVVKSNCSGKIVKDGKLVKSWGDEGPDADAQKMLDEARAMSNATDAQKRLEEARAMFHAADKSAAPSKAKAAERTAEDEIKELRQRLAELEKKLEAVK